jgi:hypothetical protein
MSARPGRLGIGDRVGVRGVPYVVVGVSGTRVRLAGGDGTVLNVTVTDLLADPRYELADAGSSRAAPAAARLPQIGVEGLPAAAVEQARWWEGHIAEVVYGLAPEAPAGAGPKPQYDPALHSLSARERTKVAELAAAGRQVPLSTLKHRRQRWEARGLAGLVDHRVVKRADPVGRADPVVVAAMRQAIKEADNESSKTAGYEIWRTGEILAGAGAQVALPSRATLYRLFEVLSRGKHTTGSASTRRSLAGRPEGMFGQVHPAAPGELMQIDSTPLDVLVLLDDGVCGRVELTGIIDVATRTISAAVLQPTTRSVDASVLLARCLTPEPMRPGWSQALSMAHSALPYERLLSIDERLRHAAARPVIVPDTIVIDHGSVYVSDNFRSSCRHLGISLQPAHLATGSDKPHIERAFGAVGTMFCQFVSGYLGRNPDRRGRGIDDQPLWSMQELQELLDEWLIACWQNHEHDGLRDPEHPGRAFTPNQKYAALVESAGYVPMALSAGDYIELLPARWRTVNAYGIKIDRRTYDGEALNPLRQQPSGVRERGDQWEVRYDPYDVSKVFVRGRDGWITVFWKHLSRVPVPFGEMAWDHALRQLRADGHAASEENAAGVVAALLRRARQGPQPEAPGQRQAPASKRDTRVAARTRAAQPPVPPQHLASLQQDAHDVDEPDDDAQVSQTGPDAGQIAKVIPMPIFDPFAEADKRW